MTTTDTLKGKPGVIGATIITRSGRYFDFLNPAADTVRLEDIAYGLAYTCRFGGQCNPFYSVAQHSILVSMMVPPPFRMMALLHDAAEAYMGDVVGPLKQLLPDYKAIERRVETVVLSCFGITLPLDPSIKHADLRALRTEQRDLTAGAADNWNGLDAFPPMQQRIIPLAPDAAAIAFLERFHSLAVWTPEGEQALSHYERQL